jgi:PadR family transcriptional regulator PadR
MRYIAYDPSGPLRWSPFMGLDREWMRGAAPLAVLTLLARQEMYGYQLVEALERDSGGLFSLGQSTVYPLLYNLEGKGHVKAVLRDAPSGRQRKYYQATPDGLKWLDGQRSQWATLVSAMGSLGVSDPGKAKA